MFCGSASMVLGFVVFGSPGAKDAGITEGESWGATGSFEGVWGISANEFSGLSSEGSLKEGTCGFWWSSAGARGLFFWILAIGKLVDSPAWESTSSISPI